MIRIKNKIWFHFYDLLTVFGFIILFIYFGKKDLGFMSAGVCGVFLAISIYTAVHNAEVIAKRVGPSIGALVLALAVTIIEVGLIVSMMATNNPESAQIARDTVFSALMIGTNGIIGICILFGGIRHRELGFQPQGTSSLISALGVLAVLTLVLPNYTTTSAGPTYSTNQLIYVSVVSFFLYTVLVWAQTVSHKSFFRSITAEEYRRLESREIVPTRQKTAISFIGLFVSLISVIGLAKTLSSTIEMSLLSLGAPQATVGVAIALLVLAPETFAALNAAKINQLQTSLNLALGSGAASIALTVPVVSVYAIIFDKSLVLGLDPKSLVFLILTFLCSGFTFSTDKTTNLKGVIHLVILVSYIALVFMP